MRAFPHLQAALLQRLRRPRETGNFPVHSLRPRGFTLVELMVVVLLITLLAAIAVPSISRQMEARQARKAADIVASLYRTARLRALGRGSAVLVNYNHTSGLFELREAIVGESPVQPGCNQLPSSSCQNTDWQPTSRFNQLLESFDAKADNQLEVSMQDFQGSALSYFDVCFTPLGRAYSRTSATAPMTPLTSVPRALLKNPRIGAERQVTILPNGTSRVVVIE